MKFQKSEFVLLAAGDNVKFGFALAFATTFLSWGMLSYEQGYANAGNYSALGEVLADRKGM